MNQFADTITVITPTSTRQVARADLLARPGGLADLLAHLPVDTIVVGEAMQPWGAGVAPSPPGDLYVKGARS